MQTNGQTLKIFIKESNLRLLRSYGNLVKESDISILLNHLVEFCLDKDGPLPPGPKKGL